MLAIFLSPLLRNVVIGVVGAIALIVGYSFWAMHERNIGYKKAKLEIASAAAAHQAQVGEAANQIDAEVGSSSDAISQLQKFWSEP